MEELRLTRNITPAMAPPAAISAVSCTAEEWQAAQRPLASLISKSEKAQQKLAPETWQYRMLRDNLKALHLAAALMYPPAGAPARFAPAELQAALQALASIIGRSEKAQAKFSPGTSQHTLQRNRLHALRLATVFIRAALKPHT